MVALTKSIKIYLNLIHVHSHLLMHFVFCCFRGICSLWLEFLVEWRWKSRIKENNEMARHLPCSALLFYSISSSSPRCFSSFKIYIIFQEANITFCEPVMVLHLYDRVGENYESSWTYKTFKCWSN